MRRHGGLLALGWAVAAWFACAEAETRPPAIGDCSDAECLDNGGGPPDVVVGGVPGGAGAGGAGGAGGTNGMPPPGAGTLLGTVSTITEPDLSRSGTPEIALEIRVPGTGTGVTGTSAADGSFRLEGVPSEQALAVAVGTFTNDPGTQVFMDTLQVVDSAAGDAVELVAMRRSVMQDLAISSFLNEPVELDPARGHALIRFVDEDGDPVPGLSLVFPTSESADIAYDTGDIYSDSASETSNRGAVALLNLVAPAYPGGVTNLVIEVATPTVGQFSEVFRVASGSVTVLTVELDLDP